MFRFSTRLLASTTSKGVSGSAATAKGKAAAAAAARTAPKKPPTTTAAAAASVSFTAKSSSGGAPLPPPPPPSSSSTGVAAGVGAKSAAQAASANTSTRPKGPGSAPLGAAPISPPAARAAAGAPPPKGGAAASATHGKYTGKLSFDASKAGLQSVDQAHVEQVIQEASRGTAFYQKELQREEQRQAKTNEMVKKAATYKSLSPQEKQAIKDHVDALEAELEATRDVSRRYIYVDMDMFFAAVEEKKDPSLSGIPFGVGSVGMLSTTNYVARQYGVRSGMPGFIGKRLCPDLVIVPVNFAAYKAEAARVHSIAYRYDPNFSSMGLDELTMDITDYLKQYPGTTAAQVATDFRDEVYAKTQLTCSAGIAPTAVLAKIASNVNKPNGQHEVQLHSRTEVLAYVKNIPLRRIPGIGTAQEHTLNALGMKTCGDLLPNKYLLGYLFRERSLRHYLAVGLGLMEAFTPKSRSAPQSIGKERTLRNPLQSEEALAKFFRTLLKELHAECVRKHLWARQLRLVVKFRTYDNQQYSIAMPRATNDLKVWLETAEKLLQPHLKDYSEYRLVGARLSVVPEGTEEEPKAGAVQRGSKPTASSSGAASTAASGRAVDDDDDDDGGVDADGEVDGYDDDDDDVGAQGGSHEEKNGHSSAAASRAGGEAHRSRKAGSPAVGAVSSGGAASKSATTKKPSALSKVSARKSIKKSAASSKSKGKKK